MIALTRPVSPSLDCCALSHLQREAIDVGRAARQHRAYERVLASLGCRVQPVPAAPDLPDAVFVEDTAVVTPEVAVVTRPGLASRRPEVDGVATVLSGYRELRWIEPPGTLDGGDVLRVGRTIWVGLSARTNRAGAEQLRRMLKPFDYVVREVAVKGCLHLKTAVTAIGPDRLIANLDWTVPDAFSGYDMVAVDPTEPFAANVLLVGDAVVVATAHVLTAERLTAVGVRVIAVDVSELGKAEGGVTCCSILLEEAEPGARTGVQTDMEPERR
ncbi:MAG: dimethylarginine dimethylaminohydrolase family protein [Gemmatimonadota bacterium]